MRPSDKAYSYELACKSIIDFSRKSNRDFIKNCKKKKHTKIELKELFLDKQNLVIDYSKNICEKYNLRFEHALRILEGRVKL